MSYVSTSIANMIRACGQHLRAKKTWHHVARRSFLSAHLTTTSCAEVQIIPLYSDNYCYVLIDRLTKQAAVVDPGKEIIREVEKLQKEKNIELTTILCTHKHDDHVGGNSAMKLHFPNVEIIGTGYEPIPSLDRAVHHEDTFTIGSLQVQTLHTPCHTRGHVCFFVTPSLHSSYEKDHDKNSQLDPILFSGDTLFAGGCGRFFEGTAEEMLHNMDLLFSLSPSTRVYCGHEYTLANLAFLRSMLSNHSSFSPSLSHLRTTNKDSTEPSIRALTQCVETFYTHAISLRHNPSPTPTIPTTIGEELKYNLFAKCREEAVQQAVSAISLCEGGPECMGDPVTTMRLLRERKNAF